MPFKSEKQRKYLWANEPAIARDWTDEYGSGIQAAQGGRIGMAEGWGPGAGRDERGYQSSHPSHRDAGGPPGITTSPTHVPKPKPEVKPDRGFYDYGKRQIKKTPSFLANVGVAKKLNIPYLLAAYGTNYVKDKFQNRDKGTVVPSNQLNEMGMMSGIKNIGSTISDAYKDWKSVRDTGNLDPNVNPNITLSDPNTVADTVADINPARNVSLGSGLAEDARQDLMSGVDEAKAAMEASGVLDELRSQGALKSQGGRIGYQMGNMVGAEMEGAEMEGAMMQSQEVIKELYDALIAQGLSPQEAIEKIKEIIASTQTQEPQSPMMGEEFPGQEFGGGPRVPAAFGGIMDTYTGRRKYLFGSFNPFKIVKKAVKKLKKLASSKFGKMALGYLATAGISNYLAGAGGATGGANWGNLFGTASSKGWMDPRMIAQNVGSSWNRLPFNQTAPIKQIANTKQILPMAKPGAKEMMKLAMETEAAQVLGNQKAASLIPGVSNKALAMIGIPAVGAGAYTAAQPPEELGGEVTAEYDDNKAWWDNYLANIDADYSVDPSLLKSAQGGRVGRQEGGLMNLGGMEKDYRNDGGFVPLGGEEKADDVPARLSRNEFVFTADAVRNAGGGDIDRGAEVMENVMKNLEGGGQISEESQGQGAQEMFETSERLSEII